MAKNATNPVEETPIEKKAKSVKKAKPVEVKVATSEGVLKALAASIEKEKAAYGAKKSGGVSRARTSTGAGKMTNEKGKMTNKKYVESTVRPAFEALVLGVKQNLIAEGKIDAENNTFDYEVWVYKDHDRKQQCVEIHMIGEDAKYYLYDDKETVDVLRALVKMNLEDVMGKVPNPVRVYDEGEKYFILY